MKVHDPINPIREGDDRGSDGAPGRPDHGDDPARARLHRSRYEWINALKRNQKPPKRDPILQCAPKPRVVNGVTALATLSAMSKADWLTKLLVERLTDEEWDQLIAIVETIERTDTSGRYKGRV